ncbi:MAG: hypothetical protein K2J78_07935, partial [Muribaculaceae bacterium]|nr:hypothetical protein [Muribaculaceae bacterium]
MNTFNLPSYEDIRKLFDEFVEKGNVNARIAPPTPATPSSQTLIPITNVIDDKSASSAFDE